MSEGDAWWKAPLRVVDGKLRVASKKAKKLVRILRLVRFAVLLLFLLPLVAAGLVIWQPTYTVYAVLVLAIYAAVPLIGIWFLIGVPLKAKSVVRLIEKGYPQNAKEFAIRTVAKKLHDQSIESEELLVDTAVNESKKMLKKYRARAAKLKQELDETPDEPVADDKEQ